MRTRPLLIAFAAVIVFSVLFFNVTGYAVTNGSQGTHDVLPDFDVRNDLPELSPSDDVQNALSALTNEAGAGVRATWNTTFGTPAALIRSGGYVDEQTRSGAPVDVAREWLMAHRDVYGLTEADVNNLIVIRDYAMPGTGVYPVTFQQTFDGIQTAAGGRFIVAVAPDGRILSVSAAAQPSAPVNGEFALSASDALLAVTTELAPDVSYTPELSGEENGWKIFSSGGVFPTVQRVREAMFPMGTEVRPVWRVLFIEHLNEGYDVLVDASSGDILHWRSLVDFDGPEGTVFLNYPGAPQGGEQVVESFVGDPDASPNGWVELAAGLSGPTTVGNNADSYANWSNFLVPEGAGIVRPIDLMAHFNYEFMDSWRRTECQTVSPAYADDVEAAVTNLFYHHNLFHDHLYHLGWVESAGNMQVDNFGKGGQAGDPILGLAQAGATTGGEPLYTGRDNAYMLTLPDGIPSWSGMFLWEPIPGAFEGECVDGDFDASVIYHEYSHALTNRMVAGGEGLSGHHSGAMGEAWSDWYALSYLVSQGLQDHSAIGVYVTGDHDRGIRNWALADKPVGFGDIGYDITGPQVHADGEIWAGILWDLREALVAKHGEQQGAQVAEQIVTDALPLSPPNPSMLDMRNAILTADLARFQGDNTDELWSVFARRGMGAGATTTGTNDINPEPAYDHLVADRNGSFVGRVVNASTNQPVAGARVFVGQFEARTSPAVTTSSSGYFGLPMAAGTYDITIRAAGFGARTLEDVTIDAGRTTRLRLRLEPNHASQANGAQIVSVSSEQAILPAQNAFDDTEASVWATEEQNGGFQNSESVVLKLAGDQPVDLETVQVSAFADIAQPRFATLRDFRLQVSTDGINWQTVLDEAIITQPPRPVAPELHYKTWSLDSRVTASYIRFVVDGVQGDIWRSLRTQRVGFAQVAEVQVFSGGRRVNVEPLELPTGEPISEEGVVTIGNPTSDVLGGVTENEFLQTCNPDPASEGVDGWVMELPDGFGDGSHTVIAQGPGVGDYDFDLYFYAADCSFIGGKASPAADESGFIPGGTRFVVADLWLGADVPLILTAAPAE